MSAVKELQEHFQTLHHVSHAAQYLSWDEAVIMPAGGGEVRAKSLATLRKISHEMATAPKIGELLETAKQEATSNWDQANLRVIERRWTRATALPVDLVVASSLASSRCEQSWRRNRKANNWEEVKPLLEEVLNLTKQKAEILGEKLTLAPYDALLDGYEAELKRAYIDPIFNELTEFLPDFVNEVIASQRPHISLKGEYPADRQMDLAKKLMPPLGFNFGRGRVDTSDHPFTCGDLWDTRITTRFGDDDFLESMYAVLHETGHALYQQGLPEDRYDQPVGGSLGMMIHESQSLFMEQQVCRSEGYLSYVLPILVEALKVNANDDKWSAENFIRNVHHVEKGFIRVEADECTYPLHVILRYELENALLHDSLSIDDLPDAWNELMDRFFGLDTRGDFANGVMQDVHWYAGLFGYFPCYTLGALTAAQLYQAYTTTNPDAEAQFAAGNFESVLSWLRDNIHSKAQLTSGFDRIVEITGKPLTTEAFVAHVARRYRT